jgi:hypothetical protein
MNMMAATKYNFHGIGISIEGPESICATIHSRLKPYASERMNEPGIRFQYVSVSAPERHVVIRPDGSGRSVTESEGIETDYFDSCNQLYIAYSDRVRVLCDAERGLVRESIVEMGDDKLWLVSHPAFTLPLAELLKRRGLFALHAAGLAIDGRAVLFAGDSGAGKSTLTITLLRKSFGYIADDMVFLAPRPQEFRILGFPDEIDLTDETIALFSELAPLARLPKSRGWRKRQVRPEQLYPVDLVSECKPGLLIFPKISGKGISVLKPMNSSEALLLLLSNIIRTDSRSSQNHLDALTALVGKSECYRLETGRDFDAIPDLIRSAAASSPKTV